VKRGRGASASALARETFNPLLRYSPSGPSIAFYGRWRPASETIRPVLPIDGAGPPLAAWRDHGPIRNPPPRAAELMRAAEASRPPRERLAPGHISTARQRGALVDMRGQLLDTLGARRDDRRGGFRPPTFRPKSVSRRGFKPRIPWAWRRTTRSTPARGAGEDHPLEAVPQENTRNWEGPRAGRIDSPAGAANGLFPSGVG